MLRCMIWSWSGGPSFCHPIQHIIEVPCSPLVLTIGPHARTHLLVSLKHHHQHWLVVHVHIHHPLVPPPTTHGTGRRSPPFSSQPCFSLPEGSSPPLPLSVPFVPPSSFPSVPMLAHPAEEVHNCVFRGRGRRTLVVVWWHEVAAHRGNVRFASYVWRRFTHTKHTDVGGAARGSVEARWR